MQIRNGCIYIYVIYNKMVRKKQKSEREKDRLLAFPPANQINFQTIFLVQY